MTTRLVVLIVVLLGAPACRKPADVRDEAPPAVVTAAPSIPSNAQELDTELDESTLPACAERAPGNCDGTNDFPCALPKLVGEVAETCDRVTNCATNGTLEVRTSAEGCPVAIAMDEPNPEIIECLVAELSRVHCPCTETVASHFFGQGRAGGCQRCATEFPCPGALECVDGVCVSPSDAGSANE
jgi:hypothetical protein